MAPRPQHDGKSVSAGHHMTGKSRTRNGNRGGAGGAGAGGWEKIFPITHPPTASRKKKKRGRPPPPPPPPLDF